MRTFKEALSEIEAEAKNSKAMKVLSALKPRLKDHPLVLYGAGRLGGVFLDICRELGIEVARFCDRSVTDEYEGIEVIDPQTLKSRFPNAFVVVSSSTHNYNDEICGILRRLDFPPERIIPCPVDYPCFDSLRRFSTRHLDGYAWAYDFFEDERSKQLVLDKLRLVLCSRPLATNTQSACYYEEGFIPPLASTEIFVDVGAYIGDTAEDFIGRFQKAGRQQQDCRVHAFEPDAVNYAQAVRRLSRYTNVKITQKGLWSTETELVFTPNADDGQQSSFVAGSATGEKYRVPVTSLDAYFRDEAEGKLPTFIKMDIEGAEKEALLGAVEIIRQNKPRLAICAYHNLEDIYELPRTILAIRKDYRFALRQHDPGYWNTVLYAV
ncbi:MAG: FkbM family methyltransferase [Candidatus Accumulibacter sp.]|jgi:FkbM family methyltransferase|nr:FkbM family methyltransferase [Accumulibacter sp.]